MTFAELPLPPPVLAALEARGYQTPTSVQIAVLDPGCAGRDLLVSSQTGSGKTIAFGAALARELLGAEGAKVPHGTKPVALVIVPTRELAAQVRDELMWLLRGTGLRIGSFAGGTPVGGDLKVLSRGVELVIGTPGRLVDLLRRERLVLSDLRAVVLDEADEMLDLGFREDLETLLTAAPAERRTLLLSATLPPEIRAMARKYQRDALPVDPRKSGEPGADGGGHDDITYRAHLIAPGDRLAAVVNVLRASGGNRAIVFCTTREGVAELHAALVARGFAAAAISGDRAQAERDRALEQLRRGDAHVLVATNVAARGIHLPDVDLIVHADLPLNADSLIHRSGRTGRAGRKGTAVVLATVSERRKAERLLSAAHVTGDWTPPPPASAIAAAARAALAEELLADEPANESSAAAQAELTELAGRLEGELGATEVIRRLLARELARLPTGEPIREIDVARGRGDSRRDGPDGPPRPRGDFDRHGVKFSVNLGAKDNADPRWLLPLICRRGNVTRREVGAIRIGPHETLFEIAGDAAREFETAARQRDPRAVHVTIQRVGEGPAPRSAPRVSETSAPRSAPRVSETSAPRGAPEQKRPQRWDRPESAERPAPAERPVPATRPVRPEPHARAERPARTERPAHAERTARPERTAHPERTDRPKRPAHGSKPHTGHPARGGFQPPRRRPR